LKTVIQNFEENMPIYEYLCKDCGTRFELIKPMSAADEKASCPKCASLEVRRLISMVNAFSGGKNISGSSGSCSSCSSSNCSSCGV